ncbi:MAG: NAD-dependent epimerase/dehydratase family protein [Chitinophagaceae bacterium]|nr:NAD-dependent epimerase/dehydratase family protein [Chitinophagaceae bacterium]
MILVTGATGLLGHHLLQALEVKQMPVRALCRQTEGLPKFNHVEWFQGDIVNIVELERAMQGVTHIYHCAAKVSYDPRWHHEMMRINIEGTANVVNLALDYEVAKMIYVSSIATLGKEDKGKLVSEQTEWLDKEPHSMYAESKYYAEMEVWRGIGEGLQAVIVNPSVILGEGDWQKSSTNLFKIVYDEFPWYTNGSTGWVDVKDVVKVMIRLMESSICQEKFIVNGANASFKDVFTMMANGLKKRPPYKKALPWMSEIVWRLAYLKSILSGKVATITKETAITAHQQQAFSSAKLSQTLPDFSFTPLEETIARVSEKMLQSIE